MYINLGPRPVTPEGIQDYKNRLNELYHTDVWNSYKQQNQPSSDWGIFGKGFTQQFLSNPIGNLANIWNTYNTWKNNKAEIGLMQDQLNMQREAYQNNERRMEQAFQDSRANRYGNML